MPLPKAVAGYFDKLEGPMKAVAIRLSEAVYERGPHLKATYAWGQPCWIGNERVVSIMAHARHCNLQLWSGARMAEQYFGRIEGSGKMLRHVKVRSPDEIDDELIDIIDRAIQLDQDAPVRVR
ncbi:DUF1801 domain-containing protein [Henriciella mobilis]|uniref:YdhG-like domain-containing protein n=1 Tax=Henriciella mobilis TaxID=2305467 RepID=A0A399RNX5_9PROT|nr:DUF1801 domain-containing protein [Henriciella mobilis]RIJ16149.1 hypothetical protein D1231_10215 [Henriciella mobilis]RIJ22939.1 hypothetical protein D1227_05385 [Henriciella mobilis]RIJ32481.1 hypothetical protein D1223_01090 [Henriciella mobilis]